MKAKKLFWALLSVLTVFSMNVALSSCEKSDNTPSNDTEDTGGGEEEDEPEPEEKPEIANPAADKTILLVNIENARCENFSLSLQGLSGEWANDEDNIPDGNLLTRVEGTSTWFQIEVPAMDDTQSNFKFRANDSWTYEPKAGYEFLDDAADYVEAGADGGNINNLMIIKPAGGKVIALKIVEMPTICAETVDYKVTLKTNYCDVEGSEYVVGIIGSIPGSAWGTAFPMEKIDDTTYEYTIKGGIEGMEFKFRSTEEGWANEPKIFKMNEDKGVEEWMGISNIKLGAETNIVVDLLDHTWSKCTE